MKCCTNGDGFVPLGHAFLSPAARTEEGIGTEEQGGSGMQKRRKRMAGAAEAGKKQTKKNAAAIWWMMINLDAAAKERFFEALAECAADAA